MNRRPDDLFLQQGRLIERIAGQREALRRDFEPVELALGKIDFAFASVRSGVNYLRHHMLLASALAGAFLIFKGKAALRWGGRAYSLWKSWRAVQSAFFRLTGR
jgi:hypothetical protein